jgi:hypothetical protein
MEKIAFVWYHQSLETLNCRKADVRIVGVRGINKIIRCSKEDLRKNNNFMMGDAFDQRNNLYNLRKNPLII